MHNRFNSVTLWIFAAFIVTAAFLPACNQGSPTPTASPSIKPTPGTSPKPTPTFDPNAPSAAYKISRLWSEKVPDGTANEYWIFIDVENTGGQPGVFTPTYRIDQGVELKDSKTINLNPGQKKQVQLIRLQWDLSQLGMAYDSKVIDERQHVVFCGNQMMPFTLAERPVLLLIDSAVEKGTGNITVTGDVKNIGEKTLEHIIAVADIGFDDSTFKTFESPVDYEKVAPNQATPFRVVIPSTPAMEERIAGFRVTFRDSSGAQIRAISGESPTK
jgi:hypothetical protein